MSSVVLPKLLFFFISFETSMRAVKLYGPAVALAMLPVASSLAIRKLSADNESISDVAVDMANPMYATKASFDPAETQLNHIPESEIPFDFKLVGSENQDCLTVPAYRQDLTFTVGPESIAFGEHPKIVERNGKYVPVCVTIVSDSIVLGPVSTVSGDHPRLVQRDGLPTRTANSDEVQNGPKILKTVPLSEGEGPTHLSTIYYDTASKTRNEVKPSATSIKKFAGPNPMIAKAEITGGSTIKIGDYDFNALFETPQAKAENAEPTVQATVNGNGHAEANAANGNKRVLTRAVGGAAATTSSTSAPLTSYYATVYGGATAKANSLSQTYASSYPNGQANVLSSTYASVYGSNGVSNSLESTYASVYDSASNTVSANGNEVSDPPNPSGLDGSDLTEYITFSSAESSFSANRTVILDSKPTCNTVGNLFSGISSRDPSAFFKEDSLPLNLPRGVMKDLSIHTNKFYNNLILGEQTNMVWTYPYGFYWDKSSKHGFAVQYSSPSSRINGKKNSNGAVSSFTYPTHKGDLVFSASELRQNQSYLTVKDMEAMYVAVQLSPEGYNKTNNIEFPLVEGMGFATAIYHGNMTLRLSSEFTITSLVQENVTARSTEMQKYRINLSSGAQWIIFLSGKLSGFQLSMYNGNIVASRPADGLVVQAAVAPKERRLDAYYQLSAGSYVTGADVKGSIACRDVQYSISYTTAGSSHANVPIIFALPHHLENLSQSTAKRYTGINLWSTTKGEMRGLLTNVLSFTDTVDINVQFYPYLLGTGTSLSYSPEQIKQIRDVAVAELEDIDVVATILLMESTYYIGKVLDKYAYMLLVLKDIVQDHKLADSLLVQLQLYFAVFALNEMPTEFMYDTKFGGITPTANNGGDTSEDFGTGYYNNHHAYYGYYLHAAAVVGYVDNQNNGDWVGKNKNWINTLVRDVANPSTADSFFPQFRYFDWFHGHSYGRGLFESANGKDEQSSSEDYNFSYGMKLWGKVIGDKAMEARGDLMLKIQSRSINSYILLSDDNKVEPADYIPNKVAGIYSDNEIEYNTYFGLNVSYIHGIHMLPITPASSSVRSAKFVEEEWTQILLKANTGSSGWNGIMALNQAIYDGKTSYDFFASKNFKRTNLDRGQSRTWALAFAGGVSRF